MKKVLAFIILFLMILSFVSCNVKEQAYEKSKLAYDNVKIAYEITEKMGKDIYEAWRLGIYDDDEILDDGVSHLASKLSLSEKELEEGVGYYVAQIMGEKWDNLSDSQKKDYSKKANLYFNIMKDDLFSFCVKAVTNAFIVNGNVKKAKTALNNAKIQMKELSKNYSDYEHYPNLKGYYTTTSSFFNFCQDPTGSFEQIKNTINDYNNKARDYISDLDYIFE